MCCLPNKFPLPVFLLLNKIDLVEPTKRKDLEGKVEEYSNENQFCNYYFLSALEKSSTIEKEPENVKEPESVDKENENPFESKMDKPFIEMLEFIFKFQDLKNKLLGR